MTQFNNNERAVDPGEIPPEEREERNRQRRVEMLVEARVPRPPAPPARRDRRGDGLEIHDPERFQRWDDVDIVVCDSIPDAEEYIGDVLGRNPQYKFVIFESISFIETVATPPIRKRWDANGQLQEG